MKKDKLRSERIEPKSIIFPLFGLNLNVNILLCPECGTPLQWGSEAHGSIICPKCEAFFERG